MPVYYRIVAQNRRDDLARTFGAPEQEANACLIAASPDLHDALLVAENAIRGRLAYETPGSDERQQLTWVLGVIHDALGKAQSRAA